MFVEMLVPRSSPIKVRIIVKLAVPKLVANSNIPSPESEKNGTPEIDTKLFVLTVPAESVSTHCILLLTIKLAFKLLQSIVPPLILVLVFLTTLILLKSPVLVVIDTLKIPV